MAGRGLGARCVVADLRFRCFNLTVLVAGAVLTLAGMYDTQRTSDDGRASGWTILALLAVLAVRSTRLGLVVRKDDVLIRSWFSTRRVSRRRIVDVSTTAYSGGWNRNGTSGAFKMLRLELVRGGHRDVQAVTGRPDRLRELRRTTRTLLELSSDAPTPSTGRRRANSSSGLGASGVGTAGVSVAPTAIGRRPALGTALSMRVPRARGQRRPAPVNTR